MKRSRMRAVFIGTLYVIIGTGSAALGAQNIYPKVKPLVFPLFLIVTAAINIRAFMDPTVAQVFLSDESRRSPGAYQVPEPAIGSAETSASASLPDSGSIPLPAGPTQLSHLEQLAEEEAKAKLRNYSVADPGIPLGPTSHEEKSGDRTIYVMDPQPAPRVTR